LSFFAGGLVVTERPQRLNRPPPYPVALGHFILPGLEGFLAPSRPDSDRAEADAAKTTFLQALKCPRSPWTASFGEGHALARACKSGALL